MATPDAEVEITAQELSVDEAAARKQVRSQPLARLKGLVTDQEIATATLRYKPYYAYETVVTKRVFAGEDIVHEGIIVVDGLSGISRPFLEEQIDLIEDTVPEGKLVEPDLDDAEAHREARSRRMQVEHREKGIVEMAERPEMVYKPVWLIEFANGAVQVVDGTNGRVVGDLTLS